jgi:transposase
LPGRAKWWPTAADHKPGLKGLGCRVELEVGCPAGEDPGMPTVPRRPAAQRERDRLEARRLHAAALFAAGVRQAEVARQLEVSAQAVSVWRRRWQEGGSEALYSRGPSGPTPRLTDQQLAAVEQALLEGAQVHGFVGELWTLDRIVIVIERLTGSSIIRPGCGRCCATGWAGVCSVPGGGRPSVTRRRSTVGSRKIGRGFCKRPTAQSLSGLLRRVRAQPDPQRAPQLGAQGQPPTLTHPFNWKKASMAAALCYGVRGGGAQLCFHVTAGNYDTDTLIEVLAELRRFLAGEKVTLLWDGLPAHRSRAMRAWLNTQRHWLVVERLPAYAPELNPTEGLWSSLKAVELANLTSPTLAEVIQQARRGVERVRRTPHLAYSFLRHAGLSVS